MIYDIIPQPKPRRFKGKEGWQIRKNHPEYWAFIEACKLLKVTMPEHGAQVTFRVQMPKSWTNKKKKLMNGRPHQQRPDIDNYCKALLDGLFKEDCQVWNIELTKLWAYKGSIEIT